MLLGLGDLGNFIIILGEYNGAGMWEIMLQSETKSDLTVFLPMCHYPTVSFYSIVEYKL